RRPDDERAPFLGAPHPPFVYEPRSTPRAAAAAGAVTGVAAATTVALGPGSLLGSTSAGGMGAVAAWGAAGATGGALGGAGNSLTNQLIAEGRPFDQLDWGRVATDTGKGAAVGGISAGGS